MNPVWSLIARTEGIRHTGRREESLSKASLLCRVAAATLLLAIGACTATPPRPAPPVQTMPPTKPPPDVTKVPDAVPQVEPRSRSGNPPFYEVDGRRYFILGTSAGYLERGVASWYGKDFHGGRTATGDTYDMYAMTAAHKTLPLPCYVQVTNLSNGRSVVVRVNDRGPFVANRLSGVRLMTLIEMLDVIEDKAGFERLLQTLDVPAYSISNPTCVDRVTRRRPMAADELRFAKKQTSRPVKVPLPGPYLLTRAMWVKEVSRSVYPTKEDLGEDVVAKTVCRHAVKANDALAQPELESLLSDLRGCAMPYTCPHGRPTLIELNFRELEKKFGRVT